MSLVIENTKPGVTAIINAGQVSRPLERQPTSTAFVVGLAPWGPAGAKRTITSWSEYLRVFGGFHPLGYLAEAAYVFFNHFAGKQMVLVRAIGEAPVKGSATVNNRVTPTPDATFKFEAKYASANVDISVAISDTDDTDRCDIRVSSNFLGIVENYRNADLRLDEEIAAINSRSRLIELTLVDDAVAGATGRPVAGTHVLADGDDDSEGMTAADMAPFLSQFEDVNLGAGQVLIPGHYDVVNTAALTAHAEAYNRLALLDHELGTEYTDVADDFNDTPSSFAAAYYPWVEMRNLAGSSGLKFYPPSIFAAGACSQVDRTIGTHKAPANVRVPNAVDVERNDDGLSVIDDNVREYLNRRNINAIAPIAGEGIKIYGARVLAPAGETRIRFVHERRMLNLIYYTAAIGFSWAVFAVVDGTGRLFRDLQSAGRNFLRSLWRAGALFGRTEADAFLVVADESNNPPEDLQEGRIHVQLGAKLSPTAEVVIINIDSVPLAENLNVLNGGS